MADELTSRRGGMHWPRPVPMLWWRGDYADIPERIRRTGRLETGDLWEPDSGDSWGAFVGRHGTNEFERFERQHRTPEQNARRQAARDRRHAIMLREQAEFEAARRARQQERQRQSDAAWWDEQLRRYNETPETVKQTAGEAYDRWVARSLIYKGAQMALVVMSKPCTLDDGSHIVQIEADRPVWLPAMLVRDMLPHATILAHASPA